MIKFKVCRWIIKRIRKGYGCDPQCKYAIIGYKEKRMDQELEMSCDFGLEIWW